MLWVKENTVKISEIFLLLRQLNIVKGGIADMRISEVTGHPLRRLLEQVHVARGYIQKFLSCSSGCGGCDPVLKIGI